MRVSRIKSKTCVNSVFESCNSGCSAARPTGKMVLTHESGIHTNSLIQNRQTYQLFAAEAIGRKEEEFLIGKHSGKGTLAYFMREAGLDFDDELCSRLLLLVREISEKKKRAILKEEFFEIYNQLCFETKSRELSILK